MHPLLKRIEDRIADAARGYLTNDFLVQEVVSIQNEVDFLAVHEGVVDPAFSTQLNILKTFISSGNATVPSDASILPYQAFVDTMIQNCDFNSAELHLANKGITHFDPPVLILKYYTQGLNFLDLSNNALNSVEIEALLGFMATNGFGNGQTINLSGGTNAAPIVNQVHQDAVVSFLLSDSAPDPNNYSVVTAITFPNSAPFNVLNIFEKGDAGLDQSDISSNNMYLHTGDGSTADDKANWLATSPVFTNPANGIAFSYDHMNKFVTLTFTNETFYPVGNTQAPGTRGGNSSVTTLLTNGATVITN